ncbi:MAG: translation initiation factor IF-2, partial [Candidatus Peribacteraceae bacterium]|nr:translation initiation factor IF-2 [Candidatus Peribacteraceae bacterium]
MRLVQVAKALGMTGQQLRKELENVDFGIRSTDREIPDNLAQGVLRFVANKNGLDIDMESLGFELLDDEKESKELDEDEENEEEAEEVEEAKESKEDKEAKDSKEVQKSKESLNVLRKLTLDDVSKEAIKKQEDDLPAQPTKKEKEEIEREEKELSILKEQKKGLKNQEQIKKKEGIVLLPEMVTVKEFAEKAGVQVPKVIEALLKNGVMATITQSIDFDTAAIVASELDVNVQKMESKADVEHLLSKNLEELLKDEPENLLERPPIVVVMGHVDHGKTAILDSIRETNVVAGEAGGITQHIGAYQVEYKPKGSKDIKKITFLDTPGHEAFTAMRSRGAQITDIAVIVVSAEDGVMPTTVEAINHAKEANIPILVAINKIDKPNADAEKVKGDLSGYGLQPEDWGGKTPVVECSAVTKKGIDTLLEHILLIAELAELKANPNRNAIATVIESHLDTSHGPLGTVVINAGLLKQGDAYVCGSTQGKIRTMMDSNGKKLDSAGLSAAVRVSGFSSVPHTGDILQVVSSEKEARSLLEKLKEIEEGRKKRSFADLVSRLSEGKLTQLKVVLKADTNGSLEALQDALVKISSSEVAVKVIHAGIGSVSETDVIMASASDGVVVAFQVEVSTDVERTAEREGVKIRKYDVVYALLEDVEGLVKGLVEPVEEEQILGHLDVKEIFMTKRSDQIVGGKVTDGSMKRLPFRIMRGG